MFESLSESLGNVFRKLSGKGRLTEANVEEGLQEVRRALLAADVSFKIVKDFIDRVKVAAVGAEVLKTVNPTQMFVSIVHKELTGLMGPVDHAIPPAQSGRPTVLMMAGLQGAGKTTTTAKLGKYFQKRGRKPMLIAADMIRPAAVEQLKTLGAQNNIPVYFEPSGRPVKICERGIAKAVELNCDVVILDTQGRLHVDREMMDELKDIHLKVKPTQTFLVVDAMTGQDAVKSADEFNKQLALDGVIMTKLDGDARGGAALSVKAIVGKPIKWVGMGERIDMLEEFHPERMADRILGMGDVVTLVEKAREAIDEEQAKKLQEKIRKDELTIDDFLKQLESMEKMGPIKSLMKMLPGGLGQMAGDIDENELKYAKAIIRSMTMQERENPELLNQSRRQRIAKGSARPVHEVNSLIKQFDEARKMIKMMKKGKGFPGMPGMPGMGAPPPPGGRRR
ncbi:MAG TPA: signal recognition particle protein [Planctomycetota bacterium]|nr:signal recognition particle protein [Planctomycetota bacterium]